MKRSILALASGAFALGASEFVMMGVLPNSAADTNVSIPTAGHYVSAYAIGVCFGALILIFGRKIKPRNLIIAFMIITIIGNFLAAISPNFAMLLTARFISGLPHGAFFGTATIMAKALADEGQEGTAVSQMVVGQTVANMVGVPFGTWLGSALTWRFAFVFLSLWAAMTIVLVLAFVPQIDAIKDAGMAGQFTFLKNPKPWFVIFAVFLGNSGIFCWWSYVSPWLQKVGGWSEKAVPILMVLAGLGMVIGGLVGGRFTDKYVPGAVAGFGQLISVIAMIAIFLDPGSRPTSAMLTFICAVGMFFISSPQQLLMVQLGEGGGEMLAGALVQIAFNAGNSVGSIVGGAVLDGTGMNYHLSSLAGVPFTLVAAALLFAFYALYERKHIKR
ncbi:MFS transporter [Alloscardovia theropitheci]|uniref:MFS transporter n=1 Tax=Alloscardovia theropitheci TaxID=2496842 RepID=A0A4R0QXB2_9BIFI|nr:MFS transporter [Alloscardovia theropitheci]TCD54200.1 MFS transporter [Alloscardovia theropitheci]